MCGGSERSNNKQSDSDNIEMSKLTIETDDDSVSSLLELAANNDVEAFERVIECDDSAVDSVGLWLVRKKGSKQVVNEERSPLMVAATYGSVDVLKLILSRPDVDVNRGLGPDKCTALHCAASGGSVHAAEVIKLLLLAGADPSIEDVNGQRPADVIAVHPKLRGGRIALEELLMISTSDGSFVECDMSSDLSLSPDNGSSKIPDVLTSSAPEKKEYPIDPSLPDIKNGVYSSDEFRMFSFKVRPCSRAYSHDWTECPFVHPGENARRRDPRKYHYSCVPCPEFRKGTCRRGDMCEYAHGVFESWLHPAQYRTRLCKDGTGCARRVCFFAHKPEELRPLYASTGSAVPSPRSVAANASVMDMATALSLLPGSPSSAAWLQQPSVPTLHLPQSSRLRSSLNARDIPLEDLNSLQDFDASELFLNDMSCFSPATTPLSRACRSKPLTPSNLDDLFSAEASGVFSPSHKAALLNQFQQQHQRMLSPINTNVFSPKNVEHPFLQAPFAVASPRNMDPISPMSARQHKPLRCFSPNGSVGGSPMGSPWSNVDWSVNGGDKLHVNNNSEGPDLSWVQTLVKEPPPEMKDKFASPKLGAAAPSGEGLKSSSMIDSVDHSVLGAWLEQMQLDQLVA